jgi:hypothetical protein
MTRVKDGDRLIQLSEGEGFITPLAIDLSIQKRSGGALTMVVTPPFLPEYGIALNAAAV